jgi:hypothetical protein
MTELPRRVRQFLRLETANELLFAVLAVLGIMLLALLGVVFFHLRGWLALLGLAPIAAVIKSSGRPRNLLLAAQKIEAGFPVLAGRLLPAVQLAAYPTDARHGYSGELMTAAVADAWLQLQPLPIDRLVRRRKALHGTLMLFLAVALTGSALRFAPERIREGLYWSFAPDKLPLKLSVSPGHVRVEKGEKLEIVIRVESPFPVRSAWLWWEEGRTVNRRRVELSLAEEIRDSQPTKPVTVPEFLRRVSEGKADVTIARESDYWAACYNQTTERYHVGLKRPLEITGLSFRYHYPSYSHLPAQSSQSREIAALVGTRVEIQGETDLELAEGQLVYGDSSGMSLTVKGRSFTGEFTVRKPQEFELRLADVTGSTNAPVRFRITPINDENPFVRLFAPGVDMNLPSTMKVMLGANSVDDYGLTSLALRYTKDSAVKTVPLKALNGRLEDTTFYLWDLSKLDLLPGSVLQYYVTVYDNDAVSGPKSSRSETFSLRFPTMTELFAQAVQKTAEVESMMTPLTDQQKQLQDQTQRLDDAMKRNRQLSWEEQQALQRIMQNQDSLLTAIKGLRQDVQKALDNMFQGVAIDSEALAGLRQLDTLLSQVLPKQLLQALDSLRSALNQNPQQIKAALQKFKYSQADMLKAIERAVDLMQRLRQEQEMNALVRKTEELYKEQEKINKNTRREGNEQLAQRQEAIKEGLDSLGQQMDALGKELFEKEVGKELSELARQMDADSLSPQAQSAAQDYRQGQAGRAKQKGQKLQNALKNLSQRMNELREKQKQKRSADIAQKLMQAANDLLTVSDAQEDIERRIAPTKDLSDLVGEEKRLGDAAQVVAETLMALSSRNMKVPPQLGEPIIRALGNANNAAQSLESNSPSGARRETQGMRSNLNFAVEAILQTLKQAQQGGGFGGGMESMLEQLSQAIQNQMQLGQEMGGMLPMPMPGGMSGELMQQWQELMARQQALREALERMMQNMGGQKPGLSSNVDAAIEEMKQLERDMATLNPQRPYVERNERIVNKLLDAQRSIRQREHTEKRESEAGKEFKLPPSPTLPQDLGERKKLLREELMRALKDDFPREYEPYVRAYFEALLK